jgi:hypothetical protein
LAAASGVQKRYYNGVDFLGQSVQPAMFGLGVHGSYEFVDVIWPGGMHERWEGGIARKTLVLRQGTGSLMTTDIEHITTGTPDRKPLIEVYPQPARNRLFLESTGIHDWEIVDVLGRRRLSGRTDGPESVALDTGSWAGGLYLLRVRHPRTGAYHTRSIVITR